ncbi:branched-chain amino acid ABC transporter permease [Ktedonosporobacter rubrisoli]|uniref:Branched-chain amino acid ABC transporter permease n=1 Tax=Ktedonosporobacter rubrisoli TaxID=2509675 RepID=A0A4P6JSA9_KTERU|nr:branched-chain amino acid ABC transporter permease [Ktedonosporobacter rubrisoli]QBD78082.1 branched-chain amino acid ABC transporter permease [Ktedonosporobacter rubrisoli]
MSLFLQLLVVGIATGAIYALIALGYTMVYGIIELINFAHGDIFMIGSMVSIAILSLMGINADSHPQGFTLVSALVLACLGSIVVCAVLGVVIEIVAYRPLRNAPRLAPLISAIGVSLILEDLGKLWKGNTYVAFPQIFPKVDFTLGPLSFSNINVLVVLIAVVLMVALQWLVTSTRIGRAMRAVAQDRDAAALMGVNVNQVISITFIIGSALAGAAGFIYGLQYGSTIFTVGFNLGLVAFTAAVLGGIGNIAGAMAGGIIIGVIESLATLIPESVLPHGGGAWSRAIIFAILILILVFRPSGLFGQQVPEKV